MDINKLSNDGLMFYYFSNKRHMESLYKQQKEIEDEINNRLDHMRLRAGRGELTITDSRIEDDREGI